MQTVINTKRQTNETMKRNCSIIKWAALAVFVSTLNSQVSTLFAQPTAFSVQGRVNNPNGTPANGPHDVKFDVWSAGSGGTHIAGPYAVANVDVNSGVFSTTVDFLGGVFTGPERWLAMEFSPAGVNSFQPAAERTRILAAPYSIYAGSAKQVESGAAVTSISVGASTLKDNISLVAGNNISLTPAGNSVRIDSSGGGGSGPWSSNSTAVYYNGGNGVGIGTDHPTARLDVRGSLTLSEEGFGAGNARLFTGTGTSELNRYLDVLNSLDYQSASGLKAGGVLVSDSYDYANPAKSDLVVKGNVCIGTPTRASDFKAKLTVHQEEYTGFAVTTGFEHTDGIVRVATRTVPILNMGGIGTLSNHKLLLFANDYGGTMVLDTNGNVGIGSDYPQAKLDVVGSVRATTGIVIGNNPGTIDAPIYSDKAVSSRVVLWNLATAGPMDLLCRTGDVCSLSIRGGCDLAEPFPMKEQQIEKGSVVVIDEEHPGQLTRSTRAYDTRVAGIVSGANGINTGIALKQEGTLDQGQNVALTGRVYVLADATYGTIKPGDLLTTSDTPGHAMKVANHAKAQGAILGKAMGPLTHGRGMVLVLVTLQ